MNILTKILLFIVVLILFGFGTGIFIAFINDKIGSIFWWTTLTFLMVSSIIYLLRDEIVSRKEMIRKRTQYSEIGKILFKNYLTDFELFYNSFLELQNNAESQSIMPIAVINDFADKKGLSLMIDWRGEENESEIESFISSQIDETISWTSTQKLRVKNLNKETNDGKFIIRLFKVIDKDLSEINKKLLFLDLGNDSYNFIVTDEKTFNEVTKIEDKDFHGSAKL